MDRQIVIGRSSELDMCLVEDMVSRKHAMIATTNGAITIQDLGSTNGTFVNGERVKTAVLKEGDRILIGTSILRLVAVDPALARFTDDEVKARMEATGRAKQSGAGRPMSGSIEDIPLPDLLQLLSTSKKSGVLSIRGDLHVGRLYLRKGQLYFASIDDSFDMPPRKAIFRLLTWKEGVFELEPPDDKQVLDELSDSTEALLMECVRQIDEMAQLEQDLPPPEARLTVPQPLTAALRDLSPIELDAFQLALNYGTLQSVLDHSPADDLDAAQQIANLLKREYLIAQ
jgi:hypothetical protein